MNNKGQQNLIGVAILILGTILFVVFAGKFIVPIIGTLIAILLINYGLESIGLPNIQGLLYQIIQNINRKFKK